MALHPLMQLQRAYRTRRLVYAVNPETGKEMRHPQVKGPANRDEFRKQQRKLRREAVHEATMTNKRRQHRALFIQRAKIVDGLWKKLGHGFSPDNPLLPLGTRRKLRREGRGKIAFAKTIAKIWKPGDPASPSPLSSSIAMPKDKAS